MVWTLLIAFGLDQELWASIAFCCTAESQDKVWIMCVVHPLQIILSPTKKASLRKCGRLSDMDKSNKKSKQLEHWEYEHPEAAC